MAPSTDKPRIVVPQNAPEVSSDPDEFTKKDPVFIDGGAPNQIFKFEKFGLSYGTDDKSHAASLLLSLMLGFLLMIVFTAGIFFDRAWIPDALKILGTAFTFTAGVAIGQGTRNSKSE